MSKAVALHQDVHNLLITNNIDNFTVSEIRDALMYSSEYFNNENETRKYIYRVICKLTKLNLLIKHANSAAKKIRYTKSAAFDTAKFVVKPKKIAINEINTVCQSVTVSINANLISDLLKEKHHHESELAITLSEIEEFRTLMQRFPKQNELFNTFFLKAREQSALLLGKVNALNKVLNTAKLAA